MKGFPELKHRKLALVQPFKDASACWIGYRSKDPIPPMAPHAGKDT